MQFNAYIEKIILDSFCDWSEVKEQEELWIIYM